MPRSRATRTRRIGRRELEGLHPRVRRHHRPQPGPLHAAQDRHLGSIGLQERNMTCFGVWGTVGSTGRWPEVVNLWELDGWDGLAANFAHEFSAASLQDDSLAKW